MRMRTRTKTQMRTQKQMQTCPRLLLLLWPDSDDEIHGHVWRDSGRSSCAVAPMTTMGLHTQQQQHSSLLLLSSSSLLPILLLLLLLLPLPCLLLNAMVGG